MSNRLLWFLTLVVFIGFCVGFVLYSGIGAKRIYTLEYAPADVSLTARISAGDLLLSSHSCSSSPCQIEYRHKEWLSMSLSASGYEVSSLEMEGQGSSIDLLASVTATDSTGAAPSTQTAQSTTTSEITDLITPVDITPQDASTTLLSSPQDGLSITLPIADTQIEFAYVSPSTQILHIITQDGLIQAQANDALDTLTLPHPIAHDMISYQDGAITLSRRIDESGERLLEYRTSESIQTLASVSKDIAALELRGEILYLYDRETKKWSMIRL